MLIYWSLIFAVALLLLVVSFKMFCLTFGIKPVLIQDILALRQEKRIMSGMLVGAIILFIIALLLVLRGGIQ